MNVPTEKWVSLFGVNETGCRVGRRKVVAGFLRPRIRRVWMCGLALTGPLSELGPASADH